ncbi:MFS transporter [Mesorhizobium sp. M7A.F.Ca.US.006.04.2.1]|uniref:MFS transporter n=1 Tax=unclassified Mesorhizobium TaxID=325217 RepID=UPI000FC9DBE3|nr:MULTISPECIES: MFS transporter [unclassified Mesorhizobium]RUX70942.1 MFS transporter [Mesorhizobium sp. M7A.F.Ca.US.005.03.1.1]RUY11154.1 MFS transporter [Mesorhizobium sp. M7A.F.Ca.US.005.03.2.1]RUY23075.1 MFS transporter [Mesorhizobium sp. M7A.F.Ca.US.001.04.2.1]RUY38695.1 MFS transporter [Mesorhizobium sp. M7A.F.Ca.US.001.04.1.1]RVA02901.1 MFS transporter [Mesorhizobium sp. M7A.F.Ca.US.001.02.1.1]
MAIAEQNPDALTSAPPRMQSAGWALASLSLATLLSSLGTSIASVGLPSLMQNFGATFQAVQWVVLAYLLAITTLIVSVGRLADMFGRRPLLLGGIALFTSASVLCGLAPTLWLLIAARAVQGLGAALMMALTLAFVAETVTKDRIGGAMGLLGAMSAIGTTLGPSLGGLLITGFGWRAIFLVNVPLGVLTFALAWRALPARNKTARLDRGTFDVVGTALLALTLAAYALAMTLGRGNFGTLNIGLLIAAGTGVFLFAAAQARVKNPLIRLASFRDLQLSASLAMSLVVATVMMATLVVAPFYLSRGLGLDAAMVGAVLSTGPLVSTLSALVAGRLTDRFGAHRMMVAGLLSLTTGTFLLSLAVTRFGIAGYVVAITVTCIGYALFQTSNNAAVMTGVDAGQRGVVSGLLNLSRNLGLITGASLMGAIFAVASAEGHEGIGLLSSEAAARGMQVTFQTATVLALAALFLALLSARATGRAESRAS